MTSRIVRSVATWLLLAGALAAALLSGQQIALFAEMYGLSYSSSISADLPAFTRLVLPLIDRSAFFMQLLAAVTVLAVLSTFRRVPVRETREHVVALIAAFLYHLVLMAWIAFVIAFFILPRAKAGI